MLAGRCLDPAARHSFDGRGAQVDDAHIALIEDLIEVLLEGRPFDSARMNWLRGGEYLGNGRVIDPHPRFVAPELISGAVGLLIHKDIVEPANPRGKATHLPQALEDRLSLVI